jgi:myo-inositol-1(or 4)-monophosphatase
LPDGDPALDLAGARDLLADAVREGGALALQTFRGELKSWIKGKSSPVSEADLAVDALLRQRLIAGNDFGWLSEETEDDPSRLQKAHVWVVDPIDGTRAYLAGQSEWVISAALVHDGRPAVAAVYAPATDELFDALAAIEPRIETVPRVPSLALRLARVAAGALDATFTAPGSHDWDLAAADLLVHEAGGALTTLTGDRLIYNQANPVHGALVAAGGARHRVLLGVIRGRIAEFA